MIDLGIEFLKIGGVYFLCLIVAVMIISMLIHLYMAFEFLFFPLFATDRIKQQFRHMALCNLELQELIDFQNERRLESTFPEVTPD